MAPAVRPTACTGPIKTDRTGSNLRIVAQPFDSEQIQDQASRNEARYSVL
jgi:hypothetical protein